MRDWLAALSDASAVLVTVAMVEGSAPREAGARMLVTPQRLYGTIGGGHLEWRAIDMARAMLERPGGAHIERFALGPSLGQCCGGVVHLVFEPVGAALADVLRRLAQGGAGDRWRCSAIDGPAAHWLFDADGMDRTEADTDTQGTGADAPSPSLPSSPGTPDTPGARGIVAPPFGRPSTTRVLRDAGGRRWLVDPCRAPRAHLVLFGAGHVGAAIVRLLADLPCSVLWADERDAQFPASVPDNVTLAATDAPEALAASAPAGSSFLVMTHSHALDLRLSEAILARPDAGWFGLIGSQTKRRQFEHRLLARGAAPERLAAMVCPIGLSGIRNKAPAAIAVSVCAQLLARWEEDERAASAPAAGSASARAPMSPSWPRSGER